MTPWMELLKATKPPRDTSIRKESVDKSVIHEGSPPETPRRLTRALARKLQQSSTESDKPKQKEMSEDAKQLAIQEVEQEGKGGERGRDTVSASPRPAIVVYTEHGAKVEPVSAALSSDARDIPTEKSLTVPTVRLEGNDCSGCGVKTTSLTHRDHTGRALCEKCYRAIADAEKELQAQVSPLYLVSPQ